MVTVLLRTIVNSGITLAGQQESSYGGEADVERFDNPAGILFQANLWSGDGAAENRAVACGLSQSGFAVQLAPRDVPEYGSEVEPSEHRKLERLTRQRVELTRSILYQAGSPDDWNLDFYGGCRIARTAFGADRLPNGWAARCNEMDEVWVPSRSCRETFAASGVHAERLRIVPTGIDTQLFRPGLPALQMSCDRGFRFLSTTDLRPRCGTDLLLRAYLNEFRKDEDVALILNISERQDAEISARAEVAFLIEKELGFKLENTAEVLVLEGPIAAAELPRLYASADAFVAVSRAPAWGRSVLEAMACELPVIAASCDTFTEFLNAGNSLLVDSEGLVPASVEEELYAGLRWAQPSVEHLRQLMRQVVNYREQNKIRARQGRRDAVARCDWEAVLPMWTAAFGEPLRSANIRTALKESL